MHSSQRDLGSSAYKAAGSRLRVTGLLHRYGVQAAAVPSALVTRVVTPGWKLLAIGGEGDRVEIGRGVLLWERRWRSLGERITVAHPQHEYERHGMTVYCIADRPDIMFAAGEFSNGVWGVFVPVDAASPLADELRTHLAEPFPASVVKGDTYGEVDAVMIGADIFGWASTVANGGRLSEPDIARLRSLADALERSMKSFPDIARPYYERLWRIAQLALTRGHPGPSEPPGA